MPDRPASDPSAPEAPIEDHFRRTMNVLAETLDEVFNGTDRGELRKVGFVLLVAEFGKIEGRVNYISNGERADNIAMMSALLARFKGQTLEPGHA